MRWIALVVFLWPAAAVANDWAALDQPGAIAIMRHALAPGTGDPAGFELGDCSTQRILNDAGRQQARSIGEAFRARGIVFDHVFTGQWCRTRETAELLGLGPVTEVKALNSFFWRRLDARQPDASRPGADRRAARPRLSGHPPGQYFRADR